MYLHPKTLFFDKSFLSHSIGIGRDSRDMLKNLQELIHLDIVLIDPIIYKYSFLVNLTEKQQEIAKRLIKAAAVILGKPVTIKLPENSTYFQSQATAVAVRGKNVKHILRLHDLFPLTNKDWFKWYGRRSFSLGFKSLAANCIFLCDSLNTLQSLKKVTGVNFSEKNQYVYHCKPELKESSKCKKCDFCNDSERPKKFFLVLATLEPRKNHNYILSAWTELKLSSDLSPDYSLILVGKNGWKVKALGKRIKKMRNLSVMRYQSCCDAGVNSLLKSTSSLISASFDEGFDLPPGEALLAGAKILLSDIPVHREIYGLWANFFTLQNFDEFKSLILWSTNEGDEITADSNNRYIDALKICEGSKKSILLDIFSN